MKNSIYLLTGAAGLLGNSVARQLLDKGENVRALVLNGDPAAENLPDGIEIMYGDLTDKSSLIKFFDVPEDYDILVIHCASLIAMAEEPSQKVYDVNVNGTKNIVDLCIERKVKKLVHISSTGAICEKPHGTKITEPKTSADLNPDAVRGYYSKTKAIATKYVLDTAAAAGLDASVIYPTGICGPDDYAFGPTASVFIKYCKGEIPVGIEGSYNSVDVRDLAAGVISCVSKGRAGEGYIMGNEIVTMKELFKMLSKYSGAPFVSTYLSTAQMIENMSESVPDGPDKEKIISEFSFGMYNLARNNCFDYSKARAELDYKTRPFEETIRDEIEWLCNIGKISKKN